MSAFEVSDTHIDALVSAALQRNHYGHMYWYHGDLPGTVPGEALPDQTEDYADTIKRTHREVNEENAETWGATLLAENRRSVNHRYDEDEWEAPYTFTAIRGTISPVAILKALDCYEYQSCEHPGWATSEAHDFCQALRKRMIHKLPGYEDAAWEITEPSQAQHAGERPIQERRAAQAATPAVARKAARTISHGATRQIERLKSTPLNCKVYTLDNFFRGKDIAVQYAWEAFDRGAKLRDNGDGTYTVRVHSNCWYELTRASAS